MWLEKLRVCKCKKRKICGCIVRERNKGWPEQTVPRKHSPLKYIRGSITEILKFNHPKRGKICVFTLSRNAKYMYMLEFESIDRDEDTSSTPRCLLIPGLLQSAINNIARVKI